jgi:hypothetical protein
MVQSKRVSWERHVARTVEINVQNGLIVKTWDEIMQHSHRREDNIKMMCRKYVWMVWIE